jgi:hypothetical protein
MSPCNGGAREDELTDAGYCTTPKMLRKRSSSVETRGTSSSLPCNVHQERQLFARHMKPPSPAPNTPTLPLQPQRSRSLTGGGDCGGCWC